jgi:GNAT superfamily N-acetyltransferase
MVHELAEFERAPEECHITEADLHDALFGTDSGGRPSGATPALFGHVATAAERDDGGAEPIAMMLWFLNFSTWEGRHGIYLEDLYVRPAARGNGLGTAMLATLARICIERGYRRLQWWVLDWNPAREFYATMGAVATTEWVPYRLTGPALAQLANAGVTGDGIFLTDSVAGGNSVGPGA